LIRSARPAWTFTGRKPADKDGGALTSGTELHPKKLIDVKTATQVHPE